jgi:hypothetical protein
MAANGPAGRKYLVRIFGKSQYKGKLAATTIKENIRISLLNKVFICCRSSLKVRTGMRNNTQGMKEAVTSKGYVRKC